jgi:hypothetical protein
MAGNPPFSQSAEKTGNFKCNACPVRRLELVNQMAQRFIVCVRTGLSHDPSEPKTHDLSNSATRLKSLNSSPERSTLIIGSVGEITSAVIAEIVETMKGEHERHVFR